MNTSLPRYILFLGILSLCTPLPGLKAQGASDEKSDANGFARSAALNGNWHDVDAALDLTLPADATGAVRREMLADALAALALQLAEDGRIDQAQFAAARAWAKAPLATKRPKDKIEARNQAARWYEAGMVHLRVFGDRRAARAAFLRAAEFDEDNQSEALVMADFLDRTEFEAAVKEEANRRAKMDGGNP